MTHMSHAEGVAAAYTVLSGPAPDTPPPPPPPPPPSDRQLHHAVCGLLLPLLPRGPGEERGPVGGPGAPLQQGPERGALGLGRGAHRGGGPDLQRAGPEYHRPLEGTAA